MGRLFSAIAGTIVVALYMDAQQLPAQELISISSNPSQEQLSYSANNDNAPGNNVVLLAYSKKLRHHPKDSTQTAAAEETADGGNSSADSAPSNGYVRPSRTKAEIKDSLMVFTLYNQNYFTSEYLDKLAYLWFDKDSRGLICPGNAAIEKPDSKDIYQQFDDVHITVFGKNAYAVGDTVDVIHSDRFVKFMGKTANLVRRVAKARITAVETSRLTALIFKAWDIISEGDRIDKAFRIQGREIDTITDPGTIIKGAVFERIENTESPYLFQTFICDRGAQDGVVFGDLFFVYSNGTSTESTRPSMLGCAVNVGEKSSTIAIEKMFVNSVHPGDTLSLIGHIRFK